MASPNVPEGCPLTYRQFITVRAISQGLTQQQAAEHLGIGWGALRCRLNEAFRRLGCSNANQAISIMGRQGWVDWEPSDEATPLAGEHPFLAAFLQEFERSRWPNEPDVSSALGMRLALAGHRNRQRRTA